MTDPKDAQPKWPTGLQRFLAENGCTSLKELIGKRVKAKTPENPKPRLPYKEVDLLDEPD